MIFKKYTIKKLEKIIWINWFIKYHLMNVNYLSDVIYIINYNVYFFFYSCKCITIFFTFLFKGYFSPQIWVWNTWLLKNSLVTNWSMTYIFHVCDLYSKVIIRKYDRGERRWKRFNIKLNLNVFFSQYFDWNKIGFIFCLSKKDFIHLYLSRGY